MNTLDRLSELYKELPPYKTIAADGSMHIDATTRWFREPTLDTVELLVTFRAMWPEIERALRAAKDIGTVNNQRATEELDEALVPLLEDTTQEKP